MARFFANYWRLRDGPMSTKEGNDQSPRKSDHAQRRAAQGRPVGSAFQDAQQAGPRDVFVQPDDRRFIVRGARGREHVFESDGQLVTSLHRPDSAHRAKVNRGERIPITEEEYNQFKGLFHE